jgi:predicted esterase
MRNAILVDRPAVIRFTGLVCLLPLLAACGSPQPPPSGIGSPVEASPLPALTERPVETSTHPVASPTTPALTPTPSVSAAKDIVYATSLREDASAESDWKLDVYTPLDADGWPVVVLLHGLNGAKEGYARWSESIAENGATVYTANWPDMVVDLAAQDNGRGYREISEALHCAIHFARATAQDYGGDSGHVTLVAHSYGTLYGAWIALASDQLETKWEQHEADRNGPPAQVECARTLESARVDTFIGIGGGRYTDSEVLHNRDPQLWEIVSPIAYLGQYQELPVTLLYGNRDRNSVAESPEMFNDLLLQAGYDSQVISFDGGHIVPVEETFEAVTQLTGK